MRKKDCQQLPNHDIEALSKLDANETNTEVNETDLSKIENVENNEWIQVTSQVMNNTLKLKKTELLLDGYVFVTTSKSEKRTFQRPLDYKDERVRKFTNRDDDENLFNDPKMRISTRIYTWPD